MQRAPSDDPSTPITDNDQSIYDDEDYSQYGLSATSSAARSFKARNGVHRNGAAVTPSKGKRRASGNDEGTAPWVGARRGSGRKGAMTGLSSPGSSPIANLPIEGLAHVFARLPPASLKACALVCREWHAIIREDNTWRAAFLYHFSLGDNLGLVPGNRLAPHSWQAEFTARHDLTQRWTKSKTPTITHDPRVGNISFIHAETALRRLSDNTALTRKLANAYGSSPSMLSISVPRGIASRSDPYNGKVAKGGFIEGAPAPAFLAGLGGNLDTVTCAAVSKEGSALVWGMANGSIHLSRTGMGGRAALGQGGQRNAVPIQLGTAFHNHFGIITAITFLGTTELFATTSTDGVVKLWDCAMGGCVWQSSEVMLVEGRGTDEGVVLSLDHAEFRSANAAFLAVGSRTGKILTWKIDLRSYTTISHKALSFPPGRGNAKAVQSLTLDGASGSLLAVYEDDDCFYRYGLLNRLSDDIISFGHEDDFLGRITAISTDFSANREGSPIPSTVVTINGSQRTDESIDDTADSKGPRQRTFANLSYVVAGDDQGRTFIWDWNAKSSGVVMPIRQLQGFETKVTALEITDILVFVGTGDGTIRAYDVLSGRLIRIFNERSAPRHTLRQLAAGQATEEDEARFAVGQIVANQQGFVASIGARVLAWRVAEGDRIKPKSTRTGGRLSSRAERYRADLEMKQEIRESSAAVGYEAAERIERAHAIRSAQAIAGVPRSLGDMTEEEATALALMLSQEEEEERQIQLSFEESLLEPDDQDDLDIDGLKLDDDDENGRMPDSRIASTSRVVDRTLPSPAASRSVSYPSSPWQYDSLSPPSMPSPMRSYSGSYGKVQVSPRLAPQHYTPTSPPLRPNVPDMAESSLWPLPSPSSLSASPAKVAAFPPSHSPGLSSNEETGIAIRKKWSEVAGRSSPNASTPVTSSAATPVESLLSQQLKSRDSRQDAWPRLAEPPRSIRPQYTTTEADAMDDELRFVLELSRAEEESRQAQASAGL